MQILGLFHKLKNKTVEREELNYLINLSTKISKAYLVRNFNRISRIYTYFEVNHNQAAMDAVADLFCMDGQGHNYNIINTFQKWNPPIGSDPEALFFLNKVVGASVEQYLSTMLRESDPFFSKIYNSVNYIIKRKNYNKIVFAGSRYIIRQNKKSFDKNFINFENFELIPARFFLSRNSYLDDIFDYLEFNTDFAPAIPLNHLVSRLKRFYLQGTDESAFNIESKFKIEEAVNSALGTTINFVEEKYFLKKKLSRTEADFFILALKDMCLDMQDGGLNPGIVKYLIKYIPDLKTNPGYDLYHNILEYLLKLMKKSLSENLQEISEV